MDLCKPQSISSTESNDGPEQMTDPGQKCGDTFFEDVTEYRPGGITKLVEDLQHSCMKVTASPYGDAGAGQAYFPKTFNSIRSTWRKTSNSLKEFLGYPKGLPQHHGSRVTGNRIQVELDAQPLESLHLLAGLHKTQRWTYLAQDPIGKIRTDRELFCFMKQQLNGRYNSLQRFISTTRVRGIHINKVSSHQSSFQLLHCAD
jgi:hypothetical protein